MHRFPLGTGLASVIGYVKILRDRWHRIIAAYAAEHHSPPTPPIAR